jgi:hypothetical protein
MLPPIMAFKFVPGILSVNEVKFVNSRMDLPAPTDKEVWKTDQDLESFDRAEKWAADASALLNKKYLAFHTAYRLHPFGIMEAPAVGDPVSYEFNGDSYPDGFIERITPSYKTVYTTTGNVYRRKQKSPGWIKSGGTWWMVPGHTYKQNPSF